KKSNRIYVIKQQHIAVKKQAPQQRWKNSNKRLMKNLDVLKQCGAGIWLARKKLEKKHKQHHVVFRLNRKKWQTHAFVAEKKRKKWFTGQEHINKKKRVPLY